MVMMMITASKEQAAAAGTGNEWGREKERPILAGAGEEGVGDQQDEDGHDDGSDSLAQVRRGSEISRMRMVMMMALTALPR